MCVHISSYLLVHAPLSHFGLFCFAVGVGVDEEGGYASSAVGTGSQANSDMEGVVVPPCLLK